jgi:hypothetical protein
VEQCDHDWAIYFGQWDELGRIGKMGVEGFYEEAVFRGGDRVQSQVLEALALTAEQILRAEID